LKISLRIGTCSFIAYMKLVLCADKFLSVSIMSISSFDLGRGTDWILIPIPIPIPSNCAGFHRIDSHQAAWKKSKSEIRANNNRMHSHSRLNSRFWSSSRCKAVPTREKNIFIYILSSGFFYYIIHFQICYIIAKRNVRFQAFFKRLCKSRQTLNTI